STNGASMHDHSPDDMDIPLDFDAATATQPDLDNEPTNMNLLLIAQMSDWYPSLEESTLGGDAA
ncbi:MAG: hypothetical protein ABIO83_05330, partial [Ilumatobacteraceae bacterium]